MPLTSHQIGGYIGGQQAMFGNFASYSTQISPMSQMGGPPPTYQNPMAGVTGLEAPPPPMDPNFSMPNMRNFGASAISAIGNVGLPAAAGAAMLGGAFMPGAVGSFFRGIDPFTRGLSAFGRGVGWQGGAGLGANLGQMASMGAGGIARAGLMGLGSAAMTALPMMAMGGALRYGAGQMVEGAQFENQVGGFLQNQFRFSNPRSETGYGFTGRERGDISNLLREMGTQDMMSTPQEMLRVMKQGVGMGLMTAVQDAKTFREKFKEMVSVAKEIATTMQTTIEGAMPFMRQARQMGFWTPQDIMHQAAQTRATAATTGMSVAQTQQMMAQGAQMARSIGAQGRYGAIGMERTMGMVGGALRSGVMSQQQLSELTGGLEGPEAVAALSQTLMQSTARFAASNRGRWAIAALAQRNMQGMDPARMQQFLAGGMSIGQIGRLAGQNVGGGNAFNFVMNEERLRGQLMAAGPEAQAAFMRSQLGDRLFGGGARDQYVTRRVIQRYNPGMSGEQADAFAQMLRQAPRIFEENARRTQAQADQMARDREITMNQSWEGMKRQIGKWWDMTVSDPLQKMGAQVARSINETVSRTGDWLFNRAATRNRVGALSAAEGQALERYAMGDTQAALLQFGSGQGLTGRGQITVPGMLGMSTTAISGQGMDLRIAAGGGQLTQRAAEGMGFKNVQAAQQGIGAARDQMGEFLGSQAVRRLQSQTMLQGREWTMELARRISTGDIAAPAAITRLVKGAGNRYGAGAAALAAAQTQEQRGWATGGLTMRGEGETESWGIDEKSVERNLENAEKGLAEAFGGRRESRWTSLGRAWRGGQMMSEEFYRATGGDFKSEDIGELRGLAGGKFEDAAKMVARAQQLEQKPDASKADREEASRLKARSKAVLNELRQTGAKDKPHLTELLDRMLDSDDKTYTSSMGKLGSSLQQKASASHARTVQRRMERFAQSLTEEGTAALTKKLEGLTGQHGAIIKERMQSLMKKEGASLDYRQRINMLEELASAAGMDPAQAAEILAMTEGTEGGEDIRGALQGGMAAGSLTGRIMDKKSSGRVGAAQQFLTQLMPGVSTKGLTGDVIKQALAGNQAAIGKIMRGADATSAKQVEEFFELARQGTPEARARMLAMGRRGAAAQGIRALSGERSLTQEMESGLKLKDNVDLPRFGQGGVDGVYKTLTAHTPLLQNIERGIALVAASTKGNEKFSSVQTDKQ